MATNRQPRSQNEMGERGSAPAFKAALVLIALLLGVGISLLLLLSDSPPPAQPDESTPTAAPATEPIVPSAADEVLATDTAGTADSTAVAIGTTLNLLAAITVTTEHPEGYSRDLFVHWSDLDGDGCNTRQEVLIRDAGGSAQVDSYGCVVVAGDWYSAYDGIWITDPSALDVDHVIPLKEAWDSGAWQWDAATREAFANDLSDPRSLIAVTAGSNRQKGAADPSNWLPTNPADRCRYLTAWVVIKVTWNLSMDESEFGRIRNLLNGDCVGETTDGGIPNRADPSAPPSAPTETPTEAPTEAPPVATQGALDPRFGSCKEAKANGFGPYVRDVDPEYDWYRDGDSDGTVCE